MTMSLEEISDRMEIQDLMVRYSYAIDSRNWDALDDVFTPENLRKTYGGRLAILDAAGEAVEAESRAL